MKTMRIVTVVCWVVVCVVLLGLAAWFVTGSVLGIRTDRSFGSWPGFNRGGFEALTGPFVADSVHNYETQGLDTINIDWVAGNVTIRTHSSNDIQITELTQRSLNDREKMHISSSGGVLTVRFLAPGTRNTGHMPQKRLEILVPHAFADNFSNLSVDAVSGNVDVDVLGPSHISVNTTSGNIAISNADSNYVHANSLSGTITITDVYSHQMRLDSTSGSVTVKTSRAGDIEIDTLSGTINVSDSLAGTVNADSTSGTISVSGAFETAAFNTLSGRITHNNTLNNSLVTADSTSGNMNLTGAFYSVETKTLSGSITISSSLVPSSLRAESTSGRIEVTVPGDSPVTVSHSSTSGRFATDIPVTLQGSGAQFEFSTRSGSTQIREFR